MKITQGRILLRRTHNDPPQWTAIYDRTADEVPGRPDDFHASATGTTELDACMRLAQLLGDGR